MFFMFNLFGKSKRNKAKEKASELYEAFLPSILIGTPMLRTNLDELGLSGYARDLFAGAFLSGILGYIAQQAEHEVHFSFTFGYEDHEATFCEVTEALGVYEAGKSKVAYKNIFNLYRLFEPNPSLSLEEIERQYSRDNPIYVIKELAWEAAKSCHEHINNKNIPKIAGAFFGKEIDSNLVERYQKFYYENINIIL